MSSNEQRYSVGQVLYVVPRRESKIVPVLVTEEITKKTLTGSVVTYRLQIGDDKTKTVMFDELSGEVFDSPGSLKNTLIERATMHISKTVDVAVSRAREWYNGVGDTEHVSVDALTGIDEEAQDDVMKVKLDDGTVARVKIAKQQ